MWFDSWDATVRVVLAGLASYAALVLLLRLSGKRTLSKLNAFDLAVTVAPMRRERLTKPEVLAAIRQAGQARIEDVGAVVLETDGSISVLPRRQEESTALHGVRDSRN